MRRRPACSRTWTSSGEPDLQEAFHRIADDVTALLRGDEVHLTNLSAEDSDFVRFNRGTVRQAGSVSQIHLTVDLVRGRRHASGSVTLSGQPELDRPRLAELVDGLREQRDALPEDPYLLYAREAAFNERVAERRLAPAAQAVAEILDASRGRDVVGIYASGAIHTGFASSAGPRHWATTFSHNLDWSVHAGRDRAVKSSYAGFEWCSDELRRRFAAADEQLAAMEKPPRAVDPGRHRVYLAPGALADVIEMLGWGGFSLRAHRTKATPLLRMIEEDARLHPSVCLRENTADGVAPAFEAHGFVRPDRVPLIEAGAYAGCLVSPRSSLEYGVPTNGAAESESPLSVEMDGGTLARDAVLRELGDGLYVSNLWYLNYSDRPACRITGMTRFATFHVEHGELTAPAAAARFDETLYRMLGEKLVALTQERDWILDPDSYGRRSTRSARLPGALIDDFTITL